MCAAIILLSLALFGLFYILGFVHDFIFWLCKKMNWQN